MNEEYEKFLAEQRLLHPELFEDEDDEDDFYAVPDEKAEVVEAAGDLAWLRFRSEKTGELSERTFGQDDPRPIDEVRQWAEKWNNSGAISDKDPDPQMIAIAQKIIEQQEGPFDPSQFVDRYEEALKALITAKQKGHKVAKVEEPEDTNVIDLMAALRASLGGKDAKPAGKASAKPAAKKAADKPAAKAKGSAKATPGKTAPAKTRKAS